MAENKEEKPGEPKAVSADPAVNEMLCDCKELPAGTVWDRLAKQTPQCTFGLDGLCCRHCAMGPCRFDAKRDKFKYGVCGVTADTVAARHFVRMIAAGTAAHSDHGRGVAETFLAAAKGEAKGFEIKDEQKLLQIAMDLGIEIGSRDTKDIAIDVGTCAVAIFGSQHGPIPLLKRAPLKRQAIWKELGIEPRGVDREVVESMHRTTMGVDQDPLNLIMQGSRTALADGWGGSMLATELQDVLFGTPQPILGRVNLGVLEKDKVNILIHGHEPLLSEMIVVVAQDPSMVAKAKAKGAQGINLAGICCTANEILMRHGVPIAGNFLHQEVAIATGAVDAMIADVQCVMEAVARTAGCFHTKIITTNYRAKMNGAVHIQFDEHDAIGTARQIVEAAIENFPNRKQVHIPNVQCDLIAGFSHETINYLLGGLFRAAYKPLNDNIINGRIRGLAGVVGCNTPKVVQDSAHIKLVKELIANDVLVLQTGCAAQACAKEGLLLPEAAAKHAGKGLAEVCEAVGIPPVLHMGSCVDNSRILMAATAVVKEGGLGDDITDLPAIGAAPEWMSEKAIAIGQYFVASGARVIFGATFPVLGAPGFKDLLFKGLEKTMGAVWDFEPDPSIMARKMIEAIDKKRAALGIDKSKERVLYDMAMRRELDAG
ncbi:MAG: anaerobic carbon-monoxide dehydrogenase catalytic subunit [Deltaproteobacteria bacterium]|nr:anaerobic carbon-monoxide dehydrogenase catalytic subunit [Deltaproteobacteria bacterium]